MTTFRAARSRWVWLTLSGAAAIYLTCFSIVAQTPGAPQGQGAPPTAAQAQGGNPPAAGPPTDPAGRGRQGGPGGRGGRGGPNETDPANAEADFTPAAPVLPLPLPRRRSTSFSSLAITSSWCSPIQ